MGSGDMHMYGHPYVAQKGSTVSPICRPTALTLVSWLNNIFFFFRPVKLPNWAILTLWWLFLALLKNTKEALNLLNNTKFISNLNLHHISTRATFIFGKTKHTIEIKGMPFNRLMFTTLFFTDANLKKKSPETFSLKSVLYYCYLRWLTVLFYLAAQFF